jgi:hypothetical protein
MWVGVAFAHPASSTVDLSILRNFRLADRTTLQFRGESFNVLNHTNLSSPGAVFGGAAFGQINASRAARVMQIGMTLRF